MRMAFFLILIGTIGAIIYVQQPTSLPAPAEQPTPQPKLSPSAQFSMNGRELVVYRQEISNNLTLIPNFERKIASSRLMEDCMFGASGGFYSQDNKPIGLFIADGKKLSSYEQNSTLNAFFVGNGTLSIRRDPPASADFAVQSGPYITSHLRIQNDTFARRILVARSGNRWSFLAITGKDNIFDGPMLSDMPQILEKLEIDEALNLDGGSASAFYSGSGVRLGELTPVGSFFCGK